MHIPPLLLAAACVLRRRPRRTLPYPSPEPLPVVTGPPQPAGLITTAWHKRPAAQEASGT